MPFFTNIPSFSSLPNPLSIFSLDPPPEAGPSTPRSQPITNNLTTSPIDMNTTTIKPNRPTIKQQSSSFSTFPKSNIRDPNAPGGGDASSQRKGSGGSVVILDNPQMINDVLGEREGERVKGRSRERPLSVVSGMTGGSLEIGAGRGGRRRKTKNPVETFIIVRPPPTAGKNPLNLQIQLVMKPPGRGRERSASGMVSLRSVSTSMTTDKLSSQSTPSTPGVSPPNNNPLLAAKVGSKDDHIVDLSDSSSGESAPQTGDLSSFPSPADTDLLVPTPTTANAIGPDLRRSSSVKSNGSSRSATSASTSSTVGSGKRIVPLYNLAVHNVVQPTTVCDAGTDSKVAKFLKRTLDITGVGILEPTEIWLPLSHSPSSNNLVPSPLLSEDGQFLTSTRSGRPLSMISTSTAPLSPTVTRDGRASPSKPGVRASLDLKGFKLDNMFQNNRDGSEGGTTKKFFGKMFKKKGAEESAGSGSLIRPRKSPAQSFSSLENVPPPNQGSGFDRMHRAPSLHVKAPSTATVVAGDHAHFGHPTFGTAPAVHRRISGCLVSTKGVVTGLSSNTYSSPSANSSALGLGLPSSLSPTKQDCSNAIPILPSSRPVGYTWTVRKWAKKNSDGWAAHLVAAASAGLELVHGTGNSEGEDEVVFEWVKMRTPGPGGSGAALSRFNTAGTGVSDVTGRNRSKSRGQTGLPNGTRSRCGNGPAESNTSLTLQIPSRSTSPSPQSQPQSHPSPTLDSRPWAVRRTSASASPSPRRSASPSNSVNDRPHDTASLSGRSVDDIEDGQESDPEDSETPWTCSIWVKKTGHRQLLGTLTPAPHHPKVIGMLKIPLGLESVALAEVVGGSNGGGGKSLELLNKIKEVVALSEENLKDVVCVTAMWLVAREEFGGLGRKKKA